MDRLRRDLILGLDSHPDEPGVEQAGDIPEIDSSTPKNFRRPGKDRPRVAGSACQRCDAKAKLVWAVLEGKLTVAGRTLVGPMTVESCPSCGTSLVEGGELRRVELEAARALLQAGIVSGTAFRCARDATRMTCEDLARELGVEPETVADWESGERPIDRLAVSTVGTIVTEELARKVQMHERLPVAREPTALGEIVELPGEAACSFKDDVEAVRSEIDVPDPRGGVVSRLRER